MSPPKVPNVVGKVFGRSPAQTGVRGVFGPETRAGAPDPLLPGGRGTVNSSAGGRPGQTTPGPYDYLRKKMPEGYDEGDWEQFVDLLNTDYRRATPGERQKLLKRSVNELVAYGKTKNVFRTPGQKKKEGIVKDIQEREGALTAAEDEEYAKLKGEVGTANAKDQADLAALTGNYANLNKQDQNALADYLSATDPMMAEIFARTSDPADVQRQLDAYNEQKGVVDKYKSLTDPQVTAKERYMSELARREFEAADKSNREAVSEQLANRGLRSGGQELAMNQSAQQGLAQDRLLKELGIQGQAVDRSMQAMSGWQSATSNLGVQSNAIRTANDSQRNFEDTFKENDAIRRQGLAGSRRTATTDTTGKVGTRQKTLYDEGIEATSDALTRAGELSGIRVGNKGEQYTRSGDTGQILADYLTDEEESEMANSAI